MRRSLIDEVDPSLQLLYWTLLFALYPFFSESSSFMLDRILSQQGAIRGSPGWEIDFIVSACVDPRRLADGFKPDQGLRFRGAGAKR